MRAANGVVGKVCERMKERTGMTAEEGKSEWQYSLMRASRLILDAVRYRGFDDMVKAHAGLRALPVVVASGANPQFVCSKNAICTHFGDTSFFFDCSSMPRNLAARFQVKSVGGGQRRQSDWECAADFDQ